MEESIFINHSTCQKCLLCTEVCPNKILTKNEKGEITYKPERKELCFKCGQCMAICETKSIFINGYSYEKDFFELPEYEQGTLERPFFDLIYTRRAVRNFKDKPVPKELLEKIVEAISFAPPGFPPVKTKILVVSNPETIRQSHPLMIKLYEKLLQMMKKPIFRYFIRKEIGGKKFKTMDEHLVPLLKVKIPAIKTGTDDSLTRNAPAMILFLADKNGEDISQDISIAATYGMLASHSLGLGGSIMDIIPPAINKSPELRKMFTIPDDHDVITSIIIGYPKYKYRRGIKREQKEVSWI
jgi:nitroreductase/NAD-dependent dihydropyrimidine dehydrogenase PreA subunit